MSTPAFETISVEGGLLSVEYLHTVARMKASAQKKTDYGVPAGLELREEINRGWKIARALRQDKSNSPQFAQEFLRQVLGFDDIKKYSPQHTEHHTDDINTPTHLAKSGTVPIVIAPNNDGLDKRQERLLLDKKITPFNLAQIYLNNNEKSLWGIVCDGNTLRLLRDSTSMTRAAYIEADLHRILEEGEGGHYSDFSLLYLIAHSSRFMSAATCPLEQWREKSMQTGIRAHTHLQSGVKNALESLGRGFLQHPANNNALQEQLQQSGGMEKYYRELMWLAYRLIFLLVTEDRNLLQHGSISDEKKTAYRNGYSISRLRNRANRRNINDDYDDLWEGLKHTFTAMRGGDSSKQLGLPALGGLFEKDRCLTLQECRLRNSELLQAIYHLSWINDNNRLTRVNYRDMGADELGSIYENLLELTPTRERNNFTFYNPADTESTGNARKTSGSYYTTPTLVDELIKSTLQPALEKINNEKALLAMRILDPACGSGHFLLAAARNMTEKLIELRSENNEDNEDSDDPADPAQHRRIAMRDIISNCICGVDKNPMSLDLAKTALWLETFDAEKPLIFLDHHLQCGDSLLGVLDMNLLDKGIPDDAYTAATGDDKATCNVLKTNNRKERKNRAASLFAVSQQNLAGEAAKIEAMREDDLAQVADKRAAYETLEQKRADTGISAAADMFAAAFLMHKQPNLPPPPTSRDLFAALTGDIIQDHNTTIAARRCAAQNGVFHWWLRYPAVKEKGGFDIILANPPWERLKLQEEEFFASRYPKIAQAINQNARRKLIAELGKEEGDIRGQKIKKEYTEAKHTAETASTYVRKSNNYPLAGKGDVNTYALFAELCLKLPNANGAAGIIVPSGIATDDTTKTYFSHLIENKRLKSIYDFENREGLFPAVDSRFRFSLLTIAPSEYADFIVFAHQTTDLQDDRRRITLTAENLRLVNPNTRTMPLYRTQSDRDICEKIYRAAPILWREEGEEGEDAANPWQVKFQAMFHMSSDSKLFHTQDAEGLVRLYEAKYMHQYDHRWATNEYKDKKITTRDLKLVEKQATDNIITTRYYVDENIMLARVANVPNDLRHAVENEDTDFWCIARDWIAGNFITEIETTLPELPAIYNNCKRKIDRNKAAKYAEQVPLTNQEIEHLLQVDNITDFLRARSPKYLMGWREITNASNKFTLICSYIPLLAVGNKAPIIYTGTNSIYKIILLAMFNSLMMDYVMRQKQAGTTLNYFYIKQLPILPPDSFTEDDIQAIVPAVLELTYTAHDMKPFYDDIMQQNQHYDSRPQSQHGKPFAWDETRRAHLRAAIDARIAHKYGLTRDDLRYILDPTDIMGKDYPSETFRILKEQETKQHKEYRTQRLVLKAYDNLAGI